MLGDFTVCTFLSCLDYAIEGKKQSKSLDMRVSEALQTSHPTVTDIKNDESATLQDNQKLPTMKNMNKSSKISSDGNHELKDKTYLEKPPAADNEFSSDLYESEIHCHKESILNKKNKMRRKTKVTRDDYGFKMRRSNHMFDNRVRFQNDEYCYKGILLDDSQDIPYEEPTSPNIKQTTAWPAATK